MIDSTMDLKNLIDAIFGIFTAKNGREHTLSKCKLYLAAGDVYSEKFLEPDRELSLNDYTAHLSKLYKILYDAAEADKQAQLSEKELAHQQNYYNVLFKITEFHGFWIAERTIRYGDDRDLIELPVKKLSSEKKIKIFKIDEIINGIKEEHRQKQFVDDLQKYPEKFMSFSNLRRNTIDSVYNARQNPRLITDKKYKFLTTGEL